MENPEIFLLIPLAIFAWLLLAGSVRVLWNSPILGILCLILLPPLFVLWAIFRGLVKLETEDQ